MSASDASLTDLREALERGDLSIEDLKDRELGPIEASPRDELWVRWSEQGVFDKPIRGFDPF